MVGDPPLTKPGAAGLGVDPNRLRQVLLEIVDDQHCDLVGGGCGARSFGDNAVDNAAIGAGDADIWRAG